MYYYRLLETSWGMVAYAARDHKHKLIRVFLPPSLPNTQLSPRQQIQIQLADIAALEKKHHPEFAEDSGLLPGFAEELMAYFAGSATGFATEFDLGDKTPFTKTVLKRAAKIPYGKTVSYGQLAAQIGRPTAFRAVAQALGSNPVPLVIPCHRVIQSDGRLGGFTGRCGVALKAKLLELEHAKV